MSRYGRDTDEIQLDIADALGHDHDVIEYLNRQHRARGWTGPEEDDDR